MGQVLIPLSDLAFGSVHVIGKHRWSDMTICLLDHWMKRWQHLWACRGFTYPIVEAITDLSPSVDEKASEYPTCKRILVWHLLNGRDGCFRRAMSVRLWCLWISEACIRINVLHLVHRAIGGWLKGRGVEIIRVEEVEALESSSPTVRHDSISITFALVR